MQDAKGPGRKPGSLCKRNNMKKTTKITRPSPSKTRREKTEEARPYVMTVPITLDLMIELEQIVGTDTLFKLGSDKEAQVSFEQKEELCDLLKIAERSIEEVEYQLKVFFYRYNQSLLLANGKWELFQLSELYSNLTSPQSDIASALKKRFQEAASSVTSNTRLPILSRSETKSDG